MITMPVATLRGSTQAGSLSVRELREGDSCTVGRAVTWTFHSVHTLKPEFCPGQVTKSWFLLLLLLSMLFYGGFFFFLIHTFICQEVGWFPVLHVFHVLSH